MSLACSGTKVSRSAVSSRTSSRTPAFARIRSHSEIIEGELSTPMISHEGTAELFSGREAVDWGRFRTAVKFSRVTPVEQPKSYTRSPGPINLAPSSAVTLCTSRYKGTEREIISSKTAATRSSKANGLTLVSGSLNIVSRAMPRKVNEVSGEVNIPEAKGGGLDGVSWERPDAIEALTAVSPGLLHLREERLRRVFRPYWEEQLSLLTTLRERLAARGAESSERWSISNTGEVVLGSADSDLSPLVERLAERLMPWRKGPFRISGIEIDAEWRSDRKWARLAPYLPPLQGASVLDIGCNNGYYLFRMLAEARRRQEEPSLLLGVDPSESFFLQFELAQLFAREPRMQYELFGLEDAHRVGLKYDLILCLGIIYHQRDPMLMLSSMFDLLKPGGTLLIESQGIPGEEPVALFPRDRYAKARNVFFVPTASCLGSWLERSKLVDVTLLSSIEVDTEEQRRTRYMKFETL